MNKKYNICLYEKSGNEKTIKLIRDFLFKYTLHDGIDFFIKNYDWIENWSDEYKSKWHIFDNIENKLTRAEIIISIGGDGTLLSCVTETLNQIKQKSHEYREIPILGINTGHLGFLATYNKPVDDIMYDIINTNYKIIDRTLIEIDNEFIALNEVVIKNRNQSKMVNVDIIIDDTYVGNYLADGIIISTPTGSTAYSLASGGPIIAGDSNVFCINPISPHSLTFRPLIIPDKSTILIKPKTEIVITYDRHIMVTNKTPKDLIIKKYFKSAQLIKPLDDNYYNILRKKLLWTEKGK